jgi:hypothetical protein
MKRLKTVFRETWGQSLVPALVAITVGTLLVVPILHYYRSSQVETLAVETTLHRQYAADAAADYAIWRLVNDPAWRSTVDGARSSGVTVTLTEPVNGIQPTVQVRPLQRAMTHALWGNSETCSSTMDWTGAHNRLIGDVHSNRGIRIKGSDTVIEGIVEYVTDIDVGDVTYIPPPPDNPVRTEVSQMPAVFDINDYDDPTRVGTPAYTVANAGQYHRIDGDWAVNDSGYVFDGLYFITGSLKLNGNSFSGQATFVALGTIEMIGSGYDLTPYVDDLSMFSNADYEGAARCTSPVVKIAGSGVNLLGGFVYAPYGLIRISGSGSLAGAFLGDSVDISAQGLTVQLPEQTEQGGGCALYDIRAEADGMELTARARVCENGDVTVYSWDYD